MQIQNNYLFFFSSCSKWIHFCWVGNVSHTHLFFFHIALLRVDLIALVTISAFLEGLYKLTDGMACL